MKKECMPTESNSCNKSQSREKNTYTVNFMMYRTLQDIAILIFKVKQGTCPIYIANLFKQYDEKTIV